MSLSLTRPGLGQSLQGKANTCHVCQIFQWISSSCSSIDSETQDVIPTLHTNDQEATHARTKECEDANCHLGVHRPGRHGQEQNARRSMYTHGVPDLLGMVVT